jgi:cytochrome c oxidase subunit 3
MALFLASLAVLFLGSIVAYLVIRVRIGGWPADPVGLPSSLWASTVLLAGASAAVEWTRRAVRWQRGPAIRASLATMLGCGLAFLVSQTVSWVAFVRSHGSASESLHGWLFYFLTGLHALHVVGGLVPLVILTVNAFHDRVSFLRPAPVAYLAMYWHFLGVVWLALFGLLALGGGG